MHGIKHSIPVNQGNMNVGEGGLNRKWKESSRDEQRRSRIFLKVGAGNAKERRTANLHKIH